MASRPFFMLSIVDLEKLFEQNKNDAALRQQLATELTHRTTQRALRLKNQIMAIEKTLQSTCVSTQDKTMHRTCVLPKKKYRK